MSGVMQGHSGWQRRQQGLLGLGVVRCKWRERGCHCVWKH